MRMRLRASGSALSPTSALRLLSRIQKHSTTIGTQRYAGVSRLSPQQIQIFTDLTIKKPPPKPLQ